jgi:branched-chain amino acid transport system permease protein
MAQALQLFVNALAIGSIYAVIALSFEIAYEASGVVNFATGQLVIVGALIGASAMAYTNADVPVSYAGTMLAMAAVGLGFFVTVFEPLRRKPAVTVVIGTVGIGIAIQNLAQLAWGPLPAAVRSPVGSAVLRVAGTVVPLHAVFVIAAASVLILAVWLLIHRTALGKQFRALAQDPETARLMGISVTRLHAVTWVLVAALAGIAGLLLAPMWFIDVTMGDSLALKAFAAAIIGGFGSIPGAICGGILVGMAEIFGASYVSSSYKDALVFVLMIGFLLLRPQGLFGERIEQRG